MHATQLTCNFALTEINQLMLLASLLLPKDIEGSKQIFLNTLPVMGNFLPQEISRVQRVNKNRDFVI